MAGPRAIIHLDMDAFYASVEQRDRPELRGKPIVVGGDARRGVVLAASYEVRPFGVRSAMPMAEAIRRAPHAEIVRPRFAAYAEASEAVFAILESVTPLFEPLSLDEAFLDVTASQALFGSPAAIATQLRARIAKEVGLPASAGIAAVKFAAKIASDLAKPNGQREVPADAASFLAPLPLGRLWGVGRKTEALLAALGLTTIGDIAARDPDWLERKMPGGRHLWQLAHGIDDREVIPDRTAKSIGAEDTFEHDLDARELPPHIHAQAARVARRLRHATVKARVVQLKVKLSDFSLLTRRCTLDVPSDDGQVLYRAAVELLERTPLGKAARLTGVAAHELVGPNAQRELFAPGPTRADQLNAALDRIQDRFGGKAIATADVRAREENQLTMRERPGPKDPKSPPRG
ncbi:MAG TPA: DNA polymerase IV [Polyangia bacterium]